MKRITLLTLIAFCGAALAANIPRSLIHGQTDEDRRAEVFSAFVALSDTRGSDAIPFLSGFADLTGQTTRMQKARLQHVSPDVLTLLAEAQNLSLQDYRQALLEGRVHDPFDHSGSVIDAPGFDSHGQDDAWFWGVWVDDDNPIETDTLRFCRIWLVIWDQDAWFYAPMGTEDLNRIARAMTPDLVGVPFGRLPDCKSDA